MTEKGQKRPENKHFQTKLVSLNVRKQLVCFEQVFLNPKSLRHTNPQKKQTNKQTNKTKTKTKKQNKTKQKTKRNKQTKKSPWQRYKNKQTNKQKRALDRDTRPIRKNDKFCTFHHVQHYCGFWHECYIFQACCKTFTSSIFPWNALNMLKLRF